MGSRVFNGKKDQGEVSERCKDVKIITRFLNIQFSGEMAEVHNFISFIFSTLTWSRT